MKCPNCGTPNLDSVRFCENCGTPLQAHHSAPEEPQQNPYQQNQYQQYPNQQYPNQQQNVYPPNGYQPSGYPQYPYQPVYVAPPLPMKWYKFLIYFALIASCVLNVVGAIITFTSGRYTVGSLTGERAKTLMYAAAPGLKGADIFYGIAQIVAAGLVFAAWFFLFKKKKNGPTCLYVTYAFNAAISVIWSIWVYAVAKDVLANPESTILSGIVTAVISVVMIIVNVIYFNKRKEIFVN